ncbi:hypothetical protein Afil01_56900 [Actinorhabdospora filicis]|uniref:Uncharacterized protein n=1 Tax=Actinorhabdospora filicis TaxID=1785913 RepID=A0A9W6SR88_9ACTN|nr:hypothetical protein [Actinorhabdospora filicis]GLZ80883.1 hypothetical protein Afil01_56900 [Actinorhabdospora filicis]
MPTVPDAPYPATPTEAPAPTRAGLLSALPTTPVSALFAAAGVLAGAVAFFGPAAVHSDKNGDVTKYVAIPISGLPIGLTSTQTALAMPVWPLILTALLLAFAYGTGGARRISARFAAVGVAVLGVGMIYGQFRDWVGIFTGTNRWTEGTSAASDYGLDEYDPSMKKNPFEDVVMSVGWGTWLLIAALVLLAVAAVTATRRVPSVLPVASPPPHEDGIEVVPDNTVWSAPSA